MTSMWETPLAQAEGRREWAAIGPNKCRSWACSPRLRTLTGSSSRPSSSDTRICRQEALSLQKRTHAQFVEDRVKTQDFYVVWCSKKIRRQLLQTSWIHAQMWKTRSILTNMAKNATSRHKMEMSKAMPTSTSANLAAVELGNFSKSVHVPRHWRLLPSRVRRQKV